MLCKSRKYLKLQQKQNISDIGSNLGILKILGVKFCTLHLRIVLPSSSILASVKSTNVNEQLVQIIIPGSVKC